MASVFDGISNGTGSASAYDIFTTLSSNQGQQALANGALSSGIDFYQKKQYSKAAGEFSRAIAMDPTNTQSYNFLANTYLQQNKTPEAIKTLKSSLSIDPQQDGVHSTLANIYMSQKKYNDAESEFKAAMKLNPSGTVAPYTLGQMYQQTGRYAEAEKQFKLVQRMAPQDPNPYYALGATLNKEGKYADAVKQLQQAVKLRPKMTAAHFELGVAYAALGDTTNANSELNTVTNLDATQGALLKATIAQPKMVSAGGGDVDNFGAGLGAGTLLYGLLDMNAATGQPYQSKQFSLTFTFDSAMDANSVQDINNWSITKAAGGVAGYYNNMLPTMPNDVAIPQNPLTVVYDPNKQQAVVTFMLSLNGNDSAAFDPSHMVFKFAGTDARGKVMDPTADEFDGSAETPF
jgi:tetratricopeptide (TPR) repeat protein